MGKNAWKSFSFKTAADVNRRYLRRLFCTRNGNRTRTDISAQGILSPSCLPIPPSEQPLSVFATTNNNRRANIVGIHDYAKSETKQNLISHHLNRIANSHALLFHRIEWLPQSTTITTRQTHSCCTHDVTLHTTSTLPPPNTLHIKNPRSAHQEPERGFLLLSYILWR